MQTNRKGEWYEIVLPSSWKDYALEELLRNVWGAPRKLIHQLRMDKAIYINGKLPDWTVRLTPGAKLQLKLFEEEEFDVVPEFYDIGVLFEDDHLLILNKPAGMPVHPNTAGQKNTLANAAAFHLQVNGEYRKVRHIHRLDQDTTGAVLFAKTAIAGAILDKMLEDRMIKRTYIALAEGILKNKKGILDKPIGRDRHHATRRRVSSTGQKAVTRFMVIKSMKSDNLTLVQCSLETGRTHQIRVHFSDIGHPLAGDVLYGGSSRFNRQALHALKLELPHPFTREKIVCHAPFLDNPPIFRDIDPFTF
ncbi:RluA family pseudouridine synthase [Bacillus sp. T33-2]|uniref:RluA family pseudouridine synthase n=1 Tax=Bacillus sp. T33-2 TaxID=2054168 RepID=UPI0035B500D8